LAAFDAARASGHDAAASPNSVTKSRLQNSDAPRGVNYKSAALAFSERLRPCTAH